MDSGSQCQSKTELYSPSAEARELDEQVVLQVADIGADCYGQRKRRMEVAITSSEWDTKRHGMETQFLVYYFSSTGEFVKQTSRITRWLVTLASQSGVS